MRRSVLVQSVSSDKEIYYRFFAEQLFLVLEGLEGKNGDQRDLRKVGRKQRALEEQGFMMLEMWGKKGKLEDICVQIIFLDVNEGT